MAVKFAKGNKMIYEIGEKTAKLGIILFMLAPLTIWKIVEILIWFFKHIHVGWN